MKFFFTVLAASYFFICSASGKDNIADSAAGKPRPPFQKFYLGGGLDGAIFSIATIDRTLYPVGGTTPTTFQGTSRLRFSYILNLGATFNFGFSRHIGAFTGIDLKNIGFIENSNSLIIKRRTYNLGVPVGIKIGNMGRRGAYVFGGGGADVPINYREKSFTIRNQKAKFNEWFSDRTPHMMPYVFAGFMLSRGITIKGQYYLNNYLNPEFTSGTVKPYHGYEVHPVLLSLGFVKRYSKKHDLVKKHVAELKTM